MSVIRHLARTTVVAGAALAAACAIATPAFAADAEGRLDRLPTRMTAGGNAAPLVGDVRNTTREVLDEVRVAFTVNLRGLDADEVSISGLQLQEDDNRVRGAQNVGTLLPRQSRAIGHTIQFAREAPAGRATITMETFIRDGGEFKSVHRTSVTTNVIASSAAPTPSSTFTPDPVPTDTGVAGAATGPPAVAQAPPAPDQDSALWPLYALGLLLVVGGGGLVALLLLRRPRDVEDEPAYAAPVGQVYGAGAGYGGYQPQGYSPYAGPAGSPYTGPPYGSPVAPTAPVPVQETPTIIMPAVPDNPPAPFPPPPLPQPTDPWEHHQPPPGRHSY